jgi:hypothetical protein
LVLSQSGDPISFRSTLVPNIDAPANATIAREPALRGAEERAGEALQVESVQPIIVVLARDNGYEALGCTAVHPARPGWIELGRGGR